MSVSPKSSSVVDTSIGSRSSATPPYTSSINADTSSALFRCTMPAVSAFSSVDTSSEVLSPLFPQPVSIDRESVIRIAAIPILFIIVLFFINYPPFSTNTLFIYLGTLIVSLKLHKYSYGP